MPKWSEINVYNSSYPAVCYTAGNIHMLSTVSKRKCILQHIVGNEVQALVRLTFYDNLLIGQETRAVVRIQRCQY